MLFVWRMAMCSVYSLAALYSIRQKFEICPIGDALWSLQISLIYCPLENPLKRLILIFFSVCIQFLSPSNLVYILFWSHTCINVPQTAAVWNSIPVLWAPHGEQLLGFHPDTNGRFCSPKGSIFWNTWTNWSFYFFLPHNSSLAYLVYAVRL